VHWSYKSFLSLGLPAVCGLALLISPWTSPSLHVTGKRLKHPSNIADRDYKQAFATALQAGTEQLKDAFHVVGTSALNVRIDRLSGLVGSAEHVGAIDMDQPVVYLFPPDGQTPLRVGRAGPGPGEYITPSGIAFAPTFLAISDFTQKRVSLFTYHGEVTSSFLYGPQGFSAQGLLYDPRSSQFFLFGNRWPQYSGASSVLLVHRYSLQGSFQGSAFAIPASAESLHLTSYDQPLVELEDGPEPVRMMVPWQNVIYSIAANGKVSTILDRSHDSNFRSPSTPMPVEDRDLASFQRWLRSWTPVVAFATDGDKALVETLCLCPARYQLTTWSLSQGTQLNTLSTNYKLVNRSGDHKFLFLQEPADLEAKSYAVITAKLSE
jgi:hypothetical protein